MYKSLFLDTLTRFQGVRNVRVSSSKPVSLEVAASRLSPFFVHICNATSLCLFDRPAFRHGVAIDGDGRLALKSVKGDIDPLPDAARGLRAIAAHQALRLFSVTNAETIVFPGYDNFLRALKTLPAGQVLPTRDMETEIACRALCAPPGALSPASAISVAQTIPGSQRTATPSKEVHNAPSI